MRGSAAALLICVASAAFGFMANSAAAGDNAVDTPANGTWFPNQTVTIAGHASNASEDSVILGSSGAFQNGTFVGTNIGPDGAIEVLPNGLTNLRYFSDFDYSEGTFVGDVETGWVDADLWVASSSSNLLRADPPGLTALSDYRICWRGITPRPIVAASASFRFVAQSGTWLEFGFANGGIRSNTTAIATMQGGLAEGAFSYNLTSLAAGKGSVFLCFHLGYQPPSFVSGSIDDFEVILSYDPGNGSARWDYVTSFDDGLDAGWGEDPYEDQWSVNASGSAPSPPSLRHLSRSSTWNDSIRFRLWSGAELQSGSLNFTFGCESPGKLLVYIASAPQAAETLLLDSSAGGSAFAANITGDIGLHGFVLRFWADGRASYGEACFVDNVSITLGLRLDSPSFERGMFASEPHALALVANATRVGYAGGVPPGAGLWLEVRATVDGSNWSNWTGQATGAAPPFVRILAFQFRVTLYGFSDAGPANLSWVEFSYYAFTRVEASSDGGGNWSRMATTDGAAANSISWQGTISMQPGLASIQVRVFDTTGAYSQANVSLGWDVFPPDAPMAAADEGAFSNTSLLRWNWTAPSDIGMGIIGYRVRVGTTAGANDVVDDQDVGGALDFTYPNGANGRAYFLSASARDGAGIWGNWSVPSTGIIVDLQAPIASAPLGPGPWINSTVLTWTWTPAGESESYVAFYEIRLGSTQGGSDVLGPTAVNVTSYSLSGASSGRAHWASIRAVDAAGNVGAWAIGATSSRADVDSPTQVPTPGGPAGFSNVSAAEWNWPPAMDNTSGIAGYEISVETDEGGNVRTKVLQVLDPFVRVENMTDGASVVIQVRAYDVARNYGTWSSRSAAARIDRTPPTEPVFKIAPAAWVWGGTLNWSWAGAADGFAGLEGFYVRMGSVAGGSNVVAERFVSVAEFAFVGATEGGPYFFSVCAVDKAGNRSPFALAGGVSIDQTPPSSPAIGALPPSPTNGLTLTWGWTASYDAGSGVNHYQAALGSGLGLVDLFPWTDVIGSTWVFEPTASGVTYFLAIRAFDAVGWSSLETYAPTGVLVDATPPREVQLEPSPAFQIDRTVILRWVAASDAGGSGVYRYEVEVRSPSASVETMDVFAGAVYSFVAPTDGNHSFRLRAVDRAGNAGPWSAAVAITIDGTPPGAPSSVAFSATGTLISLSWVPGPDAVSGVEAYLISIGTTPGATDILDARRVSSNATTFEGAPGVTYYAFVKAVDRAGNVGAAGSPAGGFQLPRDTPLTTTEGGEWIAILAVAGSGLVAVAALTLRRRAAR